MQNTIIVSVFQGNDGAFLATNYSKVENRAIIGLRLKKLKLREETHPDIWVKNGNLEELKFW